MNENQKIWTLDKHIQELDNQITPMEETKRQLVKTGNELILGIGMTHVEERLGEPYEAMTKRIGELKRKAQILGQRKSNLQDSCKRDRIGERIDEIHKDMYWFKQEAKAPVIRKLLESSAATENYGYIGPAEESKSAGLRVAMAHALDLNNLVRFSCHADFDHYKTPTDCGTCIEAYQNINMADIDNFFKSKGNRVYETDPEEIKRTIFRTVWKIQDKDKRDSYMEKTEAYDAIERPSEEHLTELREKKKTLECYSMEEADKIEGAVRDLSSKVREVME